MRSTVQQRIWACALVVIAAFPAAADDRLAKTNACLEDRLAENQNPASCVDQAHQRCLTTPEDMTASAVLCFGQARDTWNIGIASEME